MGYEYEGEFLEQWPVARRSLIVNQFCFAVRGGAKDPETVLDSVRRDAELRLLRAGDETPQQESQRVLLEVLDEPKTLRFVKFILWREGLAYAEKQKLKEAAAADYRAVWMRRNPPTEKQLKYLEALACPIIPQDSFEASELIEKYKNGDVSRS